MASSSRERRPSEFWLSPSRSKAAQPMPHWSTVNFQSFRSGSGVDTALNMRGVTWVRVHEVASGQWGIGGKALTASDVKAMQMRKA